MKSLSLNELVIEQHRARDLSTGALIADPVIDTLASAMKSTREIAEQIGAAAKTILADATATPAANDIRLKNTALALAERATKALDTARDRTLSEVKKIDRSMMIKEPKEAAELRAAVSRLSGKARADALADDYIAAAVVSAHPLLSGLHPSEHSMLLSKIQRDRYPNEIDRKDRLNKALSDLERGGNILVKYVADLAESPSVKLAEVSAQRANEIAAAATAAGSAA